MTIGIYKGETGWTGWASGPGWISFFRPGEVQSYATEGGGAVKGAPAILKF